MMIKVIRAGRTYKVTCDDAFDIEQFEQVLNVSGIPVYTLSDLMRMAFPGSATPVYRPEPEPKPVVVPSTTGKKYYWAGEGDPPAHTGSDLKPGTYKILLRARKINPADWVLK